MKRLLQIEFLKIKTYKTFWAVAALYALILILFSGAAGKMQASLTDPTQTIFSFPEVWHNLAYMASYLNLLLGILIILLVCNEFTFRTFRQNVVDGLSREEAVTAKFILIVAIALGCVAFIFIYGMIRGLSAGHFDHSQDIFSQTHYLLKLFVQMLGYMSVAALIAFFLKRSAISILLFLLYTVALERMLRLRIPDEIDRYLPMNVLTELVPAPGGVQLNFPGMETAPPLSPGILLIVAIVYFLLCLTGARLLMTRSNL